MTPDPAEAKRRRDHDLARKMYAAGATVATIAVKLGITHAAAIAQCNATIETRVESIANVVPLVIAPRWTPWTPWPSKLAPPIKPQVGRGAGDET